MELLKNYYSEAYIIKVSEVFTQNFAGFNTFEFQQDVYKDWESLELKARMRRLSESLYRQLPQDFTQAATILKKAQPQLRNCHKNSGMLNTFLADYVELYGLDNPELSLSLFETLTIDSTAEFAIRPFIVRYPDLAFKQMRAWSNHNDHQIRRLASEGCRPRLPWGMALTELKKDPTPIWPILEKLSTDESLYVKKSVANNLNDIAKDHPELVLNFAQKHYGKHEHTNWILKHGLRTLLKQGNSEALKLIGYSGATGVDGRIELSKDRVALKQSIQFTFHLNIAQETPLRIEYKIHYLKANGRYTHKVFMLRQKTFSQGVYRLEKAVSFADLTTRKHYKGLHKIDLIINGITIDTQSFEVV